MGVENLKVKLNSCIYQFKNLSIHPFTGNQSTRPGDNMPTPIQEYASEMVQKSYLKWQL